MFAEVLTVLDFFALRAHCGRGRPLPASALRDRVKEQRIRCQRLTTVLRAKTEEDDAAFAQFYFDQRRLTFDAIAAEQPARKKRVFVLRIPCDDMNAGRWERGRPRPLLVCGSRFALIADGDVRAPSI